MDTSDSSSARRHYQLGLLALSIEPTVPRERFEGWLPRTMNALDAPSAATLWVGGADTRDKLDGPGRLVAGGVALWVDGAADRASLLAPAGHSEIDLRDRWGRLTPKDGAGELGPLLSAGAGLLLGRAGSALLSASAIIDAIGGGWLILGSRELRSAMTRAFVRDGCDYVSDDQLLVRYARHQPGILLLESWHRDARRHDAIAADAELPVRKWKPVAALRGILVARAATSARSRPWKTAARDHTFATLIDSAPYVDCDPGTAGPIRELLASCLSRPLIDATGPGVEEGGRGGSLAKLSAVLDGLL
jgi:hypothetical protein